MTAQAPAQTTAPQMSARNWALLLLLGTVWGGSYFFARIAVSEMPPLMLVMFRVSIAALVLQAFLAVRGPSFRIALPLAGSFFVLALLNNVIPFSLIFMGQTEVGAGLASVLNATTPFWTAILANMLTADEKLTPVKLTGIAFGIAGTGVMIGPGLLTGLGGPLWAKLALIGGAVSYGFAFIYGRRFRGVPPTVVATGQLTASTIIMIPLVLTLYDPGNLFSFSGNIWAAVIGLAVLSTAFAYLIYFRVLASAGATNASLVTFLNPVSAILLGSLVLGERLTPFEIAGMVLIATGLIIIDGRLLARIR
ncbi:Threonine/homoserine efflux transporter RhtA [Nitratireductor aquibiodomus]|uniref:Threonine/homoserine efflux transporter RhtA n=1 Tax=Nitratireductor aquibiodomus TaxID=204799 RepID=A0A1H4J2A6_9HYPH|nr:DMT family transporter [Nitratireductor aquibiodomus]SEB40459.1 Threonine/homoserine efflux transporter RhtA [Nitratireductor aquibiodomus]